MRRTRRWQRAAEVFRQIEAREHCDHRILLGIYTLESFYRPLPLRMAEYGMLLSEGLLSPVRGGKIKNYTIGPCQLGLSTLLRDQGYQVELHCKQVPVPSIGAFLGLFRAASTAFSAQVLAHRLRDAMEKAALDAPERFDLRCRYIGQVFNGRYSYGLLLERVCHLIEQNGGMDSSP